VIEEEEGGGGEDDNRSVLSSSTITTTTSFGMLSGGNGNKKVVPCDLSLILALIERPPPLPTSCKKNYFPIFRFTIFHFII